MPPKFENENIFACRHKQRRLKVKRFYRLNQQIRADQVRVIDEEGKQIGVLALSEALEKAKEKELDLVEIAPAANPPVVKIIEFKKFKYLEERKEKEARKHAKQTELKEVRFSPFIGKHDLETGLEKVKKFIEEGDLVKITIVFKGRQMAHTEFGPKVLGEIMTRLEGKAEEERPARFEGRRYATIIKPAKHVKSEKETNENQNQKISQQKIQNNQTR